MTRSLRPYSIADDFTVIPDLVFDARRVPKKSRVDGTLTHWASGASWLACSGSKKLLPLPQGLYLCKNFRVRTKVAMVKNGIGFSIDLEPTFLTDRTDLRIHPDGNLPGTEGCIGITDPNTLDCYWSLKNILGCKESVYLTVVWE